MKDRILRISVFAVILAVLIPSAASFSSFAAEEPTVTGAKAAYILCLETGDVLFEYNPEITLYPTSSVKMMTAIVAIEALSDRLDEQVSVTSAMLREVSGNRLGLEAGEVVTVNDLIHILITGGNNDGAYCLANLVAGSTDAFVAKMNDKAKALGANNTHYTNPTGMHDAQMTTTLYDTVLIAQYARSLPIFEEASGTPKYVMDATNKNAYRNIYNRNCLISKYYDAHYYNEKCSGLNAGSTEQGGHCVITVAKNGDLSYLVAVMGADSTADKIYSYVNVQALIDWAFDSFAMVSVLHSGDMIYEIPVTLSAAVDFVTLTPSEDVSVFLPTDVNVKEEITYSWYTTEEELEAPLKEGQVVGRVSASRNGVVLGTSDLVVTSDVDRSDFLYTLDQIERFTKSGGFIAGVIMAIVLAVAVIFVNAYRRKSRNVY